MLRETLMLFVAGNFNRCTDSGVPFSPITNHQFRITAFHSVHFTAGSARSAACAASYISREGQLKVTLTETKLPLLDGRARSEPATTLRSRPAMAADTRCSRPALA